MRFFGFLLLFVVVIHAYAGNQPEQWITFSGDLESRKEPEPECGELLWHAGSSFEGAYAWWYGGVVSPFYGAFSERYTGEWEICLAWFGFTRSGPPNDQLMDVYVWDDDGDIPGSVRCVTVGVDPGEVSLYANVSFHGVELLGCCTEGTWWIGYWGDWPGEDAGWLVVGDLDGNTGGVPKTNIAPGLGYPTGWQDVSVIWGPTNALAIGAEVVPCDPTPARDTTWGTVKALYANP